MSEVKEAACLDLDPAWTLRRKPLQLIRRWEFGAYADTRRFLDHLTKVSERTGVYPDLNFGRMHVSATLTAAGPELSQAESEFARLASATL